MVPLDAAPGTELVCIDASPRATTVAMPLVLGALYTLRGWVPDYSGDYAVLLEEVRVRANLAFLLKADAELGFYRDRFRVLDPEVRRMELLSEEDLPVGV